MISISRSSDISLKEVLRRSPVAGRLNAEKILRECVHRSIDIRYGFVDGQLACMWGLIPPTLLSTTAYLWMLATEVAAQHKFLLVRHSQRYIEEALKIYPTIVGDVMCDNPSGKRWLGWLGAEFGPAVDGKIPFMIRKKAAHG